MKTKLGVFVWLYFFVLLREMLISHTFDSDTHALIAGADAAFGRLMDGKFLGCPGVNHFPLFQYLPSMLMSIMDLDNTQILHGFSLMSHASFFGCLLILV